MIEITLFGNDGEQITLAQDQVFLAVDFDLSAAVFCEQNSIVDFYIHGDAIAFVVAVAFTN
jgi:hypothetical protein